MGYYYKTDLPWRRGVGRGREYTFSLEHIGFDMLKGNPSRCPVGNIVIFSNDLRNH